MRDRGTKSPHILNGSVFNDISPERYDIRQSRMIYLRSKYDIISVPSYAEHISSTTVDIISKDISPVPQETDIIGTFFTAPSIFRGDKHTACYAVLPFIVFNIYDKV